MGRFDEHVTLQGIDLCLKQRPSILACWTFQGEENFQVCVPHFAINVKTPQSAVDGG